MTAIKKNVPIEAECIPVASGTKEIKLLLVDDHALLREMLSSLLTRENGFRVVGTAVDAEEAILLATQYEPDIIVMDINMPGLLCFDAARRIRSTNPGVRIIFLSAYTKDHYIEQALKVGARGYLTKKEPPISVVHAIREVAAGGVYFSEQVRDRIVIDLETSTLPGDGASRTATLTPRELEVLRYVARGLAKKEIAGIMHIGMKTVEKHTENLMAKLDIHDRVKLARFAIREGLAEP